MTKLLLTAYGFSNDAIIDAFFYLLPTKPAELSVAIVSTSWPEEKELHPQMQKVQQDFLAMGFPKVDFIDVEFQDSHLLEAYDVIFLGGGYPFFLLHHLKKSGADKIIKKMADKDKIIVGLSAGSIVMGPDLELMEHLYPEDNVFKETDLTALNLFPLRIFPHFKELQTREENLPERIRAFEEKIGSKIIRMDNNQAWMAHGGYHEVITGK